MRASLVLTLMLLPAALAGCADDAPRHDADGSVTLVTDPSQGRLDPSMGEHLHDYWGTQRELGVVDDVVEVGGIAWGGESIPVAEFRPESGHVVPQGASEVRVTLSWTDADAMNKYDRAELWVKKADDSSPLAVAEVVKEGQTVVVPTGNGSNDLPHQLLSAWAFQLVLSGDPEPAEVFNIQYSGDVSLVAVAVRGDYEIPLFPGHPDQWQGRTEIKLLELSGDVLFDGDTVSGDWRCYAGDPGCPFTLVPDDGAIVPIDADHVTIVLERELAQNPSRLGVKHHSALSRDFETAPDVQETPTTRTYTVPVGEGGDGPYAKQSQWEFLFYITHPQEHSVVYERFHLTITAHKDP